MNERLPHFRPGCSFWHLLKVSLALYLGPCLIAMADGKVGPFAVQGTLIQKSFREGDVMTSASKADFSFCYSNGWWEAQLIDDIPPHTIENCMTVPGGLRRFTFFEGFTNQGMIPAETCPLPFPPPGLPRMFTLWLSLCPNPQLPLIDDKKMHRFAMVPDCEVEILNLPENIGIYRLSYLEPGKAFLSRLSITNNGLYVGMDVGRSGGLEKTIFSYSPPFDLGFLETQFEVLATTNRDGVAFPLRAVLKLMSPNCSTKNRQDTVVRAETAVEVTSIKALSPSSLAALTAAPGEMFAQDLRSTNGTCAVYVVTNDFWPDNSEVKPYLWHGRQR
jgi:hypothetical protein